MIQKILYRLIGLGMNLWSLVAPEAAAQGAYRLFGRPPKPHLRPKERAFLDSARQLRDTLAGQPVLEYHWGPETGPLIVLAYGWHYNAGRWRHFVPDLVDAGYHVVAYDPPGHGLNPGRFLNVVINSEILTALIRKYGRPHAVVGHSFGGASTVRALSRLEPSQRPLRAVVMASFSHVQKIFEEYRTALGFWSALYYRMVRYVESIIGAPLETFDFALLSSQLGDIQALLVHDPADRVTPFENALRYQSYWPGSRLLRAKGGHHLGAPEVTRAILSFVTTGELVEQAEVRRYPVQANHDLERFFAGVEV